MFFEDFVREIFRCAQAADVDEFLRLIFFNFNRMWRWSDVCHVKSGDTVAHVASATGCVQMLKTPLMLACTKRNLEVVKVLIEAGADPSLTNKDGWNSFHIACREGYENIISYLLSINPLLWNTKSNNGRTPLHTAALHGQLACVKILLHQANYNADEQDLCGTTPLMDASSVNHVSIINLLIEEHKASVDVTDVLGRTALHFAAQAGSLDSINYLVLQCKVNVNTKTPVGQTALHFAAKENQIDSIKLLLKLGADIDIADVKGRKAVDIALGAQHLECVKVLCSIDLAVSN